MLGGKVNALAMLALVMASGLSGVAPVLAQQQPVDILDGTDAELRLFTNLNRQQFMAMTEQLFHEGRPVEARQRLLRIANIADSRARGFVFAQLKLATMSLDNDDKKARMTAFYRFTFDTLKGHPIAHTPHFLAITNGLNGSCNFPRNLDCLREASAAGMLAIGGIPAEPPERERQRALMWRARYLLDDDGDLDEIQRLLRLVEFNTADHDKLQDRLTERERNNVSRIENVLHEAGSGEARTMLQALVNPPSAERGDVAANSDFTHVADTIERLKREGQLVRAVEFARFSFDSLKDSPKAAGQGILSLSNALASMCAQVDDRDCLQTSSAAGAKVISGPFDEIEQEALKWRVLATLLSGDIAESRRLAAQLPESRGDSYPAFVQDIQDLLVFEQQLSNNMLSDLQLAVLDGFSVQDRSESEWLLQRVLENAANRLLLAGRMDEAEVAQRDLYAISLAVADSDSPAALSANNGLGYLLGGAGRWDEAEPFFRRSWDIAESADDWSLGFEQEVAAWVHFLLETGQKDEADQVSERVWLEAGGASSHIPFAQTSYSEIRARVLMRLARFSDARAIYQRVYDSKGEMEKAWAATNLAAAAEGEGNYAAAEPYRREAAQFGDVVLSETAFGLRRVRPKLELAKNLAKQGKADEADSLFEEMLEQSSRIDLSDDYARATIALGYARHLLNTGRAGRAIDLSGQALDVLAARLERLGVGVGETAYLDAVSEQRDAAMLQIESLLASSSSEAMLQSLLAATQRAEVNAAASAMALASAETLAVQAGAGEAVQAWRGAQRRVDTVDTQIAQLTGQGPSADLFRLPLIEQRRTAFVRLQEVERELENRFPRFFDLARPAPVNLASLRENLGANEALIVLVPTRDEAVDANFGGVVMAISRDDFAVARIALNADAMTALIKGLHDGLARSGSGYTRHVDFDDPSVLYSREKAFELYTTLFADPKIAQVLADKPQWTLAPQGSLIAVSYAALVTTPPQGGEIGDGDPAALRTTDWLGMERALAVTPSVASLVLARNMYQRAVSASKAFFGFGDPAFGGKADPPVKLPNNLRDRSLLSAVRAPEGATNYYRGSVADLVELAELERLPGTALEVQTLAEVLGAEQDSVAIQLDATEANVAAQSASGRLEDTEVILFATHGLIATDLGGILAEPALALTPPLGVAQDELTPSNDGLLTASEAAQLRLTADWLILSACNTSAGSEPGAQGLSGLARGFLYAGARALLVSHFPVSDRATPLLTTTAVEERRRTGVSRAEALREARRRMLADTRDDNQGQSLAHPKAWAALSLISPSQ